MVSRMIPFTNRVMGMDLESHTGEWGELGHPARPHILDYACLVGSIQLRAEVLWMNVVL